MIGVFGGTFDPVHNGHLRVALDALEQLGLVEVRLVPLAHAVHRDQPETPPALRLAMLEAAVAGRPRLVVDRREFDRTGPSYSVDTLADLRRDFPGSPLCLLLGSDAFNGFHRWHKPETILAMASLAILTRPDTAVAAAVRPLYEAHRVPRLDPGNPGQIVRCPVTQLGISSSDIRHRRAAQRSIDFLVPDPVLQLIRQYDLYR
jgi:nicotinate-nucleotide adenylyltransferase